MKNEQQLQEIKEKLEEMTDCMKIEQINCIRLERIFIEVVQIRARVRRKNINPLYIKFYAMKNEQMLNGVLERVSEAFKIKVKEMLEK